MLPGRDVKERRSEKRDFFSVTVEYSDAVSPGRPDAEYTAPAITLNMSPSGIGLYTGSPLTKGRSIHVFSDKIGENPFSAEVMWCSQVSKALYRVGLLFSGVSAAAA